MDFEKEIKMTKLEHELAVLNARKLEIKKQTLESKRTLATLESEMAKVNERVQATQSSIEQLIVGE